MVELNREQAGRIAGYFSHCTDSLVLSYLQGHFGRGWADRMPHPGCAQVSVAGFTYYAGDSGSEGAEELLRNISGVTCAVPQDAGWARRIQEIHQGGCTPKTRYALKNEGDCFDRGRLNAFVDALPPEYEMRRMDEALCRKALENDYSWDLCGNFPTSEDFVARGLGFCAVLPDGEIACGASSYTMYNEGIEVEILTREDHRRKGLATICAAKLVLECLERGLYPSWDAANLSSVGLAEKLGYHFDHEYTVYEIGSKE